MIGWKPDVHVIFDIRRKQISTIQTGEKVGLVFCWWAPFPQLSLPLVPALSCSLFWNLSVTLSSLTRVMPQAPPGSLFWLGFLWPFASLWVWMTLAAERLVCVSFSKFKHSSRNFIPQGWGAPRSWKPRSEPHWQPTSTVKPTVHWFLPTASVAMPDD